jgi:hypothetical protein
LVNQFKNLEFFDPRLDVIDEWSKVSDHSNAVAGSEIEMATHVAVLAIRGDILCHRVGAGEAYGNSDRRIGEQALKQLGCRAAL